MKTKIETEQEIQHAIASFSTLINHPGYILLRSIVEDNIEFVSQNILNGIEGETKESIDRLRDKLKVYKEVINTPHNILARLTTEDTSEEPNNDPFYTVDSLKKEKKEAVDNSTE